MMRDSDLLRGRRKDQIVAFLLAPILLPLVAGRFVFFGALDVANAMRQIILEIRDMPMPRPARARLLPFWVAWVMAVTLLAGGLAGTVLAVKRTGHWDSHDQWVTRGAAIALALFAFYLAFRLALVGTAALQRALAHNLALLVSFELAELKAETMARAEILAAGGNSPAFRLPFFREEREDIAKLLGEPTEEALRRLLFSLEAFNSATATDDQRQATLRMSARLADVDLQLGRALLAIDPFCHRLA
jgi:hypothetical protein